MKQDKTFIEWANEYIVCNEFAVAYKRVHENAVLKVGETTEGDLHCYVYDPDTDRTLDATLSQFEIYGPQYQDDWWSGDDHPHVEEVAEYDDILPFVEHVGGRTVLTDSEREQLEA